MPSCKMINAFSRQKQPLIASGDACAPVFLECGNNGFRFKISQSFLKQFRRNGQKIVSRNQPDEPLVFDDGQTADVFLAHHLKRVERRCFGRDGE